MATLATLMVKLNLDAKGFDKGVGQAQKSASGLNKTLGKLGKGAMQAGGMVVKGIGLASGAVLGLAASSAKVAMVETTFDNLSSSIGETSEAMMTELRGATVGVVSDFDLMLAGNKLVAMGLADTAESAGHTAKMAVTLGTAMGEDATDSMENWALMMANQSIPRLDSFGISSGVVRERILELMAANDQMTREQAFTQAVMEQGEIAMAKVGDTSGTTAMEMARLKATMTNVKNEVGKALLPILSALLKPIGKLVAQIGPKLVPMVEKLVEWFENLSEPAQQVLAVVMGLSAVFAGASVALTVLGPMIPALGMALGVLTGPIGLVVAAVALLGVMWAKDFGGIRKATKEFLTPIIKTLSRLRSWLTWKIPGAVATLRKAFDNLTSAYKAGGIKGLIDQIIKELGKLLPAIGTWVKDKAQKVADKLVELFNLIKTKIPLIAEKVKAFFQGVLIKALELAGQLPIIWEGIQTFLQNAWAKGIELAAKLPALAEKAKEFLQDLFVKGIAMVQAARLGDKFGVLWGKIIGGLVGYAEQNRETWAGKVAGTLAEMLGKVETHLQPTVPKVARQLNEIIEQIEQKGFVEYIRAESTRWSAEIQVEWENVLERAARQVSPDVAIPGLTNVASQIMDKFAAKMEELTDAHAEDIGKALVHLLEKGVVAMIALHPVVAMIRIVRGLIDRFVRALFETDKAENAAAGAKGFLDLLLASVVELQIKFSHAVVLPLAEFLGTVMLGAAKELLAQVKDLTAGLMKYLSAAVKGLSLSEVSALLVPIGEAIVQGLVDGIESFIGNVKAIVTRLMDSIPQWVKDLLGIHSPSMVMYSLGAEIPRGLASGIISQIQTVVAALHALFGAMGKETADKIKAYAHMLGAIGNALSKAVQGLKDVAGLERIADFGKYLNRLFQYLMPAFNRFFQWAQWFTEAPLERVMLLANAIASFVSILSASIAGLKAVGELGPVKAFKARMERLADYLEIAVKSIVRVANTFKSKGLAAARRFSSVAGPIVDLLKRAVDGLQAVGDMKKVRAFNQRMKRLADYLDIAVTEIARVAEAFKPKGLAAAQAFAISAGSIVAILKSAVDGLKAIGDMKPVEDFAGKMVLLAGYLKTAVGAIGKVGKDFGPETLGAAKKFAAAVGPVTNMLKGAIAGIKALVEAEPWGDITGNLTRLVGDIDKIFIEFKKLAAAFYRAAGEAAGDLLLQVTAYTTAVSSVVSLITGALAATKALAVDEPWGDITANLDRLVNDITRLFIEFKKIALAFYRAHDVLETAENEADAILERVKSFVDTVGAVVGIIANAVTAIKALLDYQTSLYLPDLATALVNDIRALVEAFRIAAETLAYDEEMNKAASDLAGTVGAVTGAFSTALGMFANLFQQIDTGELTAEGKAVTQRFADMLIDNFQLIKDAIDKSFELIDYMISLVPTYIASWKDSLTDLGAFFAGDFTSTFGALGVALDVVTKLADYSGLAAEKVEQFVADVEFVLLRVVEAVEAIFSVGTESGVGFTLIDIRRRGLRMTSEWLLGMIDGIEARAPAVIAAIQQLINDLVGTAEATLGISSPSKAFEAIGASAIMGLVEGILNRARDAANAMMDLIDIISGGKPYYSAGQDSAWEWLRGWADAMRAAELSPVIPATAFGGMAGATVPVGTGTTAGGDTYNLFVTYRNAEDEGSLRDTIRALQMAGA